MMISQKIHYQEAPLPPPHEPAHFLPPTIYFLPSCSSPLSCFPPSLTSCSPSSHPHSTPLSRSERDLHSSLIPSANENSRVLWSRWMLFRQDEHRRYIIPILWNRSFRRCIVKEATYSISRLYESKTDFAVLVSLFQCNMKAIERNLSTKEVVCESPSPLSSISSLRLSTTRRIFISRFDDQ